MKIARGLLAFSLALACGSAAAQFPSKPVRILTPAASGTAVDTLARLLANALQSGWNQSVTVEGNPAASGIIAAEAMAKSAPDGYTLLVTQASVLSYNQSLFAKLPYDPLRDFTPISQLVSVDIWALTQPSIPVRTYGEFVAFARSQPGKLAYSGTGGQSGLPYISSQLLRDRGGMDMTFINYKASSQAITDMLGGRLHLFMDAVPSSIALVRAGKLKPLAVLGPRRLVQMPDVPTIAEAGYPEATGVAWNGMVGRAGTPPDILTKVHADVIAALNQPAVRDQLLKLNFTVIGSAPEEFGKVIRADADKWGKVIRDYKIRVE